MAQVFFQQVLLKPSAHPTSPCPFLKSKPNGEVTITTKVFSELTTDPRGFVPRDTGRNLSLLQPKKNFDRASVSIMNLMA